MKASWYINRLAKMPTNEVMKRVGEYFRIGLSYIHYSNPSKCAYDRFVGYNRLGICELPGVALKRNWKFYQVYDRIFDLSRSVDWYFSDHSGRRWPQRHFSRINYRPGNCYGDIRINWELNRLQFLPVMAISDENMTRMILSDWLVKNPGLYGPGYLASMEVALRWISIYWSVCLLREPLESTLREMLVGLAMVSGKYIESRLSTHSSAGNHLIVEAVGLFWIGMALKDSETGIRWVQTGRKILEEQVPKQISPDGTNKEQSFWYLGFVYDALLHYLLLERRSCVGDVIVKRLDSMTQFLNQMTLPDGGFPDYGDRDDGYVSRLSSDYAESTFPGLISTGACFLNKPQLYRDNRSTRERLAFWKSDASFLNASKNVPYKQVCHEREPFLKVYKDGGMCLMKWEENRILFRHAPLGLGDTCGHGHADALSVLFWRNNIPVLIDLGSGQYNGERKIRNYFRSTLAHNTVEIEGKNQAEILGPFLWKKSYRAILNSWGESPLLFAEASHDGYVERFSVYHTRKVEVISPNRFDVYDSFVCPDNILIRGAFHLGSCRKMTFRNGSVDADFGQFRFVINLPECFNVKVYFGSEDPFIGWRSTVYGAREPIYSLTFSSRVEKNFNYKIGFNIIPTV